MDRLCRKLGITFDWLLDLCAWIGCALLGFQVVSVSIEVLCRYFFDLSFSIVTPLNEWSLVYLTFIGAAWLQREGGHTSDDSIVTLLPPWVNWAAERFGWVLAVTTCMLLTWYGTIVTWDNFSKDTYDFFKLREVPIAYIYVIIPIGSLLWLIQLLRRQSWPGADGRTHSHDSSADI
ncbi:MULTISPECIES: TRAP transporter small permease [unclassified Beijerinckia]|uniref:TRAP transporter small permease n=1 Tax=unclassified Beijerinckia TaxID=2638183 RepID=UPI00089C7F60|nr:MULTISPECIES: TRAP transporter small permease [unclassified Beijerinckia]MDH7799230.1 TRAP-type C4-dicarboxylate transport system permease small subunit [Beijerinckia sp. GAS462]SED91296.1 TRAP-type C4-dicarboxylate transport system, small permease component [Beijerinckia sp. 28-YEA-48]